jgi:hypothetical protein
MSGFAARRAIAWWRSRRHRGGRGGIDRATAGLMRIAIAALAALGLVAGLSGCFITGDTCDHPDQQEISCEPLPATSTAPGCVGRPADGAGGPASHLDDRYPVGCKVRDPVCLVAYPADVMTCTCGDQGDGTPVWYCPV